MRTKELTWTEIAKWIANWIAAGRRWADRITNIRKLSRKSSWIVERNRRKVQKSRVNQIRKLAVQTKRRALKLAKSFVEFYFENEKKSCFCCSNGALTDWSAVCAPIFSDSNALRTLEAIATMLGHTRACMLECSLESLPVIMASSSGLHLCTVWRNHLRELRESQFLVRKVSPGERGLRRMHKDPSVQKGRRAL